MHLSQTEHNGRWIINLRFSTQGTVSTRKKRVGGCKSEKETWLLQVLENFLPVIVRPFFSTAHTHLHETDKADSTTPKLLANSGRSPRRSLINQFIVHVAMALGGDNVLVGWPRCKLRHFRDLTACNKQRKQFKQAVLFCNISWFV